MTVETIKAPNDNVPKYNGGEPNKIIKIAKSKFFLIPLGLLALFFLIQDGFGAFFGFIFMIVMLLMMLTVAASYLKIFKLFRGQGKEQQHFKATHEYYKQYLIDQHGFNVKYEALGILIDESARKIAFTLDPEMRPQITICDFGDVQRWNAYDRTVTQENEYGVVNVSHSNYFVSVYIRDPEQPRYDFFALNDIDADKWVARFNALLN